MLAPVVVFVYNRLEHTKKTIQALSKNSLAKDSEIFIFSDASKDESDIAQVLSVREYIKSNKNNFGFKKVTLIEAKQNQGLAKSITSGVSKIVKEYKKVIVLEDDMITSKYFLKFMNDALVFYEQNKKIMHISGWNYPLDSSIIDDVIIWRVMNCWGWATWDDRWEFFSRDIDKTINSFSKQDIRDFNIDNSSDFFAQIRANKEKKINTWAVFWYASIFKNKGLCVNASKSFVKNIGFDELASHCKNTSEDIYLLDCLNNNKNIKFINDTSENKLAITMLKEFFKSTKKTLLQRIITRLKKVFYAS